MPWRNHSLEIHFGVVWLHDVVKSRCVILQLYYFCLNWIYASGYRTSFDCGLSQPVHFISHLQYCALSNMFAPQTQRPQILFPFGIFDTSLKVRRAFIENVFNFTRCVCSGKLTPSSIIWKKGVQESRNCWAILLDKYLVCNCRNGWMGPAVIHPSSIIICPGIPSSQKFYAVRWFKPLGNWKCGGTSHLLFSYSNVSTWSLSRSATICTSGWTH